MSDILIFLSIFLIFNFVASDPNVNFTVELVGIGKDSRLHSVRTVR